MSNITETHVSCNEALRNAFVECIENRKRNKISVTARFDADVVEWYRAKGKGYQTVMNAALRACMEVEKQGQVGIPT